MIIFSSDMFVLRTGGDVLRSRRVHIATFCRSFGTVFHHAAATALAVRTVPVTMIEPAVLAALMSKSRLAKASPACLASAPRRAVPVTAVATTAEEEHLSTARRTTDDEPK
jgi:hypothetical protein